MSVRNISPNHGKSVAELPVSDTPAQIRETNQGYSVYQKPIRVTLSTKEEKEQYKCLTQLLGREEKRALEYLLKSGKLLDSESNDKSTTLTNLYKLATTERADDLDAVGLLSDTIISLANPYSITQKFGKIPEEYRKTVIDELTSNSQSLIDRKNVEMELDNLFSGCCVAASEQFNLASKQPAEYARFVEGLSSPEKSVKKQIYFDSLSENTMDAISLLESFDIPFSASNFQTATLTLSPDKHAYTRAKIQQKHREISERSAVDVLMQSTFMNVASQQTYNSLNDKRAGKFSNDDSGLIDYEKTFLESIVEDKNIMSVTYQNIDENQTLVGYLADYDTVKSQLLETIEQGDNIIIGYTLTDRNNKIIGAHEITITGCQTNSKGELYFICNDTDDDIDTPIAYPATYLIPKIHHAGIPEEIAMKSMEQTETWRLNIREMNKNTCSLSA